MVNVAVHVLAGVLVLHLSRRVFPGSTLLPLAAAALFVAHPVQTQAVTYVVQRIASLAGALSLLSLWLYVRAREERQAGRPSTSRRHVVPYVLAVIAGALAVYTKEIAAVLPAQLLLFDRCFVSKRGERLLAQLAYLAPWLIAPACVAFQAVGVPLAYGTRFEDLGHSEVQAGMPAYLLTQAEVVWRYARLAVVPLGQALHYDDALTGSFTSVRTLVSLAGLAAVVVASVVVRKRSPRLSFAIAWFLLGLSVESTVIVLDPVFEHRLYLPLLGVAIAATHLLSALPRTPRLAAACVLVLALSALAVTRNRLWTDAIAFYEDNLRREPSQTRVLLTLAGLYASAGRDRDSRAMLERVLPILETKATADPKNVGVLTQLASVHDTLGRPREAIRYLELVIAMRPRYDRAYADLGVVYTGLGDWPKAEAYHRRALALSPYVGNEHYNLGVVLYRQGRKLEALREFETATRLSPFDPDPLYNLGVVLVEERRATDARQLLPRLARLSPKLAEALRSLLDRS